MSLVKMSKTHLDEERLKAFAANLKEGYKHMKAERFGEAKKLFFPYIELMKKSGARQFRLFYSYSIAQIRTGDIDGFIESYHEVQTIPISTKEEEEMKYRLDELFFALLDEMQKGT